MSERPVSNGGRFPRRSGILLHLTSLPGPHGAGDMGPGASAFLDWLAEAGQRLWQVLPLNPAGYGNSPYSSPSAFALNPLLISLETLSERGLISGRELASAPELPGFRADFPACARRKFGFLARAWETFRHEASPPQRRELEEFRRRHEYWLEDFALFVALKAEFGDRPWLEWPPELIRREPPALESARARHRELLERVIFEQFVLFRQWRRLGEAAARRGIALVGDIPIFVNHDSADVWAHRELFLLDSAGRRRALSGVPPKAWNQASQIWGNPLYDWEAMAAEGYAWWKARFARGLGLFDILRVDHFSGFHACWHIPPAARNSAEGKWMPGPGEALFRGLESELGPLPIIAEAREPAIHLEVEQLLRKLGYAPMRWIQYAFDGDPKNDNLPANFPEHCTVNTGSHDDDTILGWYRTRSGAAREQVDLFLGPVQEGGVGRRMIELLSASAADTVFSPLSDVFGLGSEGRMNIPGTPSGQWEWRFLPESLTEFSAEFLRRVAAASGRSGAPRSGSPAPGRGEAER